MPKVLIIDDDPVILNIIRKVLSERGYRVEIAAQGTDGIRKFQDGTS